MKLNRKRIKSKIIGFNFTALFFFSLSCISFTFAWFAYNNVVKSKIEIGVSAWHIELHDGDEEISYEVLVPINEFYPGIKTYTKTIEILNKGDIDAQFDYKISKLRIFDEEFNIDNQEEIFDSLQYVLSKEDLDIYKRKFDELLNNQNFDISEGRKFSIDGVEGAKAIRIVLTAYESQGREILCK